MKKYLIANWKMNLTEQESYNLAYNVKKKFSSTPDLTVVLAPAFPCLRKVGETLKGTKIELAAQDVASASQGAFTGEVSAAMLKEAGCSYAIIGHSERRTLLNESDEMINKKINECYRAHLTPILCLGESQLENSGGQRDAILAQQLQRALSDVSGLPDNDLLIAYEPIWAIGSGEPMEAQEMQPVQMLVKRIISSLYSEKFYEEHIDLLYGGSVSPVNAGSFWELPFLHGLLTASASLDATSFYEIAIQAETK